MVVAPQAISSSGTSLHEPVEPSIALQASIVVPFFNEAPGATSFLLELFEALQALDRRVEVLLVDDGSTDGTAEILEGVAKSIPRWRLLRQGANQGQAAALFAGMRAARSPVVVTLDGDGQNDPGDIARLLDTLEQGAADMVAGVREQRRDSRLRRRMSRLANAVRKRVLDDGVSDTGCGLKAFRREVVEAFLPIRTLYSFMPALAVAAGFRVVEVRVRHHPRRAGRSKYGLGVMLWRPLVDMLGVWWFTRRRFAVRRAEGSPE